MELTKKASSKKYHFIQAVISNRCWRMMINHATWSTRSNFDETTAPSAYLRVTLLHLWFDERPDKFISYPPWVFYVAKGAREVSLRLDPASIQALWNSQAECAYNGNPFSVNEIIGSSIESFYYFAKRFTHPTLPEI